MAPAVAAGRKGVVLTLYKALLRICGKFASLPPAYSTPPFLRSAGFFGKPHTSSIQSRETTATSPPHDTETTILHGGDMRQSVRALFRKFLDLRDDKEIDYRIDIGFKALRKLHANYDGQWQWCRLLLNEHNRERHDIPIESGAILIAQLARPELDENSILRELDLIADLVRNHLAAKRLATLDPSIAAATPNYVAHDIIVALNEVLFAHLGFHSSSKALWRPESCFLHEVIFRRTGLPVSLSVLYMAVAHRLGVSVHGVNTPGHFVTTVDVSAAVPPTALVPLNPTVVIPAPTAVSDTETATASSAKPRGAVAAAAALLGDHTAPQYDPDNPPATRPSRVFIDVYNKGQILTRSQLLERLAKQRLAPSSERELAECFRRLRPVEIYQRIVRNLLIMSQNSTNTAKQPSTGKYLASESGATDTSAPTSPWYEFWRTQLEILESFTASSRYYPGHHTHHTANDYSAEKLRATGANKS